MKKIILFLLICVLLCACEGKPIKHVLIQKEHIHHTISSDEYFFKLKCVEDNTVSGRFVSLGQYLTYEVGDTIIYGYEY